MFFFIIFNVFKVQKEIPFRSLKKDRRNWRIKGEKKYRKNKQVIRSQRKLRPYEANEKSKKKVREKNAQSESNQMKANKKLSNVSLRRARTQRIT